MMISVVHLAFFLLVLALVHARLSSIEQLLLLLATVYNASKQLSRAAGLSVSLPR